MSQAHEVDTNPNNELPADTPNLDKSPEAWSRLIEEYWQTVDDDRDGALSKNEISTFLQSDSPLPDDARAAFTLLQDNYKLFRKLGKTFETEVGPNFDKGDLKMFKTATSDSLLSKNYVENSTFHRKVQNGALCGTVALGSGFLGGPLVGVLAGGGCLVLTEMNPRYNGERDARLEINARNKLDSLNYFAMKARLGTS